jgi:PTH2 family peptidyl-tRNA hydrolase
MNTKQVIVMRKDLGMRKGKMIAQGSHASLGALLKFFDKIENKGYVTYKVQFGKDSCLDQWLNGIFTKICLYVNSEEELDNIKKLCDEAKIPNALIVDSGLTEFHGNPTKTCIGIGPWYSEEIDKITGNLSLL